MHTVKLCPECRTPLGTGAADDLCPRCVLERALAADWAAAPEGPRREPTPPDSPGASAPAELAGVQPPAIPDHEMLRQIGQGAYGDVWLARSTVMGAFRAVKVVYRSRFPDARPFQRELDAIRKFDPVSRTHPGLVHLLHTGQSSRPECFYYVMELADDETTGQTVRPATYRAKTLAGELARKRRLPLADCLQLGLSISSALEHLHRHGLIHRDIKPANIVFHNGAPQLADIGLVTEIGDGATMVGTPSYMPPEGPGQPPADVYALGKVLYVAVTGLNARSFPELPSDLTTFDDPALLHAMNEVILKACEPAVRDRFASAGQMHAALQRLSRDKALPPTSQMGGPEGSRRRKWLAALAAAAAVLCLGALLLWAPWKPQPGSAGGPPAAPHSALNAPHSALPTSLPASAVLDIAYHGRPPTAADAHQPQLRFDLLARRKGAAAFTPLKDGDALASEVDDYLVAAQALSGGWLYVFQVDTHGNKVWLFPRNPTAPLSSGENPVPAGTTVQIPPSGDGRALYLDRNPGIEHIYAVFSASRWTELETALARPADAATLAANATRSAATLAAAGLVNEPFGLGLRGVGGARPAEIPPPPGPAGTRPLTLPLTGAPLAAAESLLVIERWFRHVAHE